MMKRTLTILVLLFVLSPAWAQMRKFTVHTVDELIEAIGDNRVIVLAAGRYNFSQATPVSGSNFYWEMAFGTKALHITGVKNLQLRSETSRRPILTSDETYGFTLVFEDCKGILLERLRFERDLEHANALGGGIKFLDCEDVQVKRCSIGAERLCGLELSHVNGFRSERSTIAKASSAAIHVDSSKNVVFVKDRYTNNRGESVALIRGCSNVQFHNCFFWENHLSTEDQHAAICAVFDSQGVAIYQPSFQGNAADHLVSANEKVTVIKPRMLEGQRWRLATTNLAVAGRE